MLPICFLYASYMLPICFLYASRWYVGNSVRLACQGGDHSKESNLNFWQNLKFPRASERRVLPIVGVCISSSHLHICSSSHLLILTSSHLLLLSSCPLALSFFSISLLKAGAGAVPTRPHETQPFRTKWGSIAKNWCKIAISTCPAQPFRTKWGSIAKNWGKIAISTCPAQPFRTKWGSIAKNCGKIAISKCPEQWQPFRTKWCSIAKNWGKIAISTSPAQSFHTKWGSIAKNWWHQHRESHKLSELRKQLDEIWNLWYWSHWYGRILTRCSGRPPDYSMSTTVALNGENFMQNGIWWNSC